jgi:rhodanese-related sulfurtransferase
VKYGVLPSAAAPAASPTAAGLEWGALSSAPADQGALLLTATAAVRVYLDNTALLTESSLPAGVGAVTLGDARAPLAAVLFRAPRLATVPLRRISILVDAPRAGAFRLSGQLWAVNVSAGVPSVPLLGALPAPPSVTDVRAHAAEWERPGTVVVDTRPWAAFRAGHLPGAIQAPLGKMLPMVVGSYVKPEERIVLVCEPARAQEVIRDLVRIGYDHFVAVVSPDALMGAAAGAAAPAGL